jgi:hypothetical protein
LPEEILPDILSVWVRDTDAYTALGHELMFTAREWTAEAELAQALHEFSAFDGPKAWH